MGLDDYPWTWASWAETISLFPKLRTLWLRTPLALSEDLGKALSHTLDETLTDDISGIPAYLDLGKYLEGLVSFSWAEKNPSIRQVYLFFGYDENLNITDGIATTGCQYRVSKTDSGSWNAINIAYWECKKDLYHSFDGLPGILDEDRDPFPELSN